MDGAEMKPLTWHLEACGVNPCSAGDLPASLCLHTGSHPGAGDTMLSLLPRETIKVKASTITQPSDSMKKGDTHAHAQDSHY